MGKRFEWDQPAKNYFQVADGITLREYLKDEIAKGGSVKARAESIGVTETALRQAISRELRSREVIRTPLGINWEAPAVGVVGSKHPVNPCRVSLINWCSDCLDEECYTREELAKLIGCKPEDLQAALNKYLGDTGDELDEEEPEAECVEPENNIPVEYTPEPEPVMMYPGGGEVSGMRCSIPGEDPEFDAILQSVADGKNSAAGNGVPALQDDNGNGLPIPRGVYVPGRTVTGDIIWDQSAIGVIRERGLPGNPIRTQGYTLIQWCVLCIEKHIYGVCQLAEMLGCEPHELDAARVKYYEQKTAAGGDACATRDTAETAEPWVNDEGFCTNPITFYLSPVVIDPMRCAAFVEAIGLVEQFQFFMLGYEAGVKKA